jgi:two-component system NarL family response regulator
VVTVLIADDHMIAREGLRAMLDTTAQIRVIGEAHNGKDALDKVNGLQPAIVLMDYKMPELDGLEATRRIKTQYPAVSVIMMSTYEDEGIVVDAVQAGASGYLVKDCSRDLLLHTVLAVASGGMLVKASLLQRAFGISERGAMQPTRERPNVPALPVEALTGREESILRLMAEGKTNRAIAEAMGFAEVTIKKHVQDIIAKLYATDRTHAAIIAMRLGFID